MTTVGHEDSFAGQGSVLLDIVGGGGALVVTMPVSLVEVEVGTRPVGDSGKGHHHHTHDHHPHHPYVVVVNRPVADGGVATLVLGELEAGAYDLDEKGADDVHPVVAVSGGQVTEAHWDA